MSATKTSTVTLTARELTALVAPVLPHASKDDTLPLLCSVRIRSQGGYVTAQTTDRYRIGMKRIRPAEAPADGFEAVVEVPVIARIRSIFKATRAHDPVLAFEVDGDVLRVSTADTMDIGEIAGAVLEFRLRNKPEEWPSATDRIIREALDSEAPTDAAVGSFNPTFLADFRHGQEGHLPLRIRATGGPTRPWLVLMGDDFIGLIVPIRMHDGDNAAAGLPAPGWGQLVAEPAEKVGAAA